MYQVFGEDWFKMSLADHLRWAAGHSKIHDARKIAQLGERVIVSEWCLALPIRDFNHSIAWEWMYLSRSERAAVLRSFALRQLHTFAKYTDGWFFWSWRDEDSAEWSLKECVSRRYLSLLDMPTASPTKLPPPMK